MELFCIAVSEYSAGLVGEDYSGPVRDFGGEEAELTVDYVVCFTVVEMMMMMTIKTKTNNTKNSMISHFLCSLNLLDYDIFLFSHDSPPICMPNNHPLNRPEFIHFFLCKIGYIHLFYARHIQILATFFYLCIIKIRIFD